MKQHIQRLLRQKWALPAATGVVGFGAGVIVGYMRTRYQYDKIEAQLEELKYNKRELEIISAEFGEMKRASTKRHPSNVTDLEPPATDLEEKHSTRRKDMVRVDLSPLDIEERGKAVVTNIFGRNGVDDEDEWDYKTEIESRDKTQPYVIHVDEFLNDEKGWDSQSTLTWYEKDQILCDDHDRPIYNHNEVVGELLFGHGSNDVNVVYIRNERLQAEYEVLRDEGSYEEIVLGEQMDRDTQEEELRHSHQMRFREE